MVKLHDLGCSENAVIHNLENYSLVSVHLPTVCIDKYNACANPSQVRCTFNIFAKHPFILYIYIIVYSFKNEFNCWNVHGIMST